MNTPQIDPLDKHRASASTHNHNRNRKKAIELKLKHVLQTLNAQDAYINNINFSTILTLLHEFHEEVAKSPDYQETMIDAILQPIEKHDVLMDLTSASRFINADLRQISTEYPTSIESLPAENGAFLVVTGGVMVHFYQEISSSNHSNFPITKLLHSHSQTYAENEALVYSASSEHIVNMQAVSPQTIILFLHLPSSRLYGNFNYFPMTRPEGATRAFFARCVR
jgi:hypothetical protein